MVIDRPVNTPEAWSERARMFWEPWTACGWSYEGQVDRHEAVVEALGPRPGESLLDWGCGTGELLEVLPAAVDYWGFDTAPAMIERAKVDHADRHVRFTAFEPYGHFDVVACVGPFNLPGGWSKQHTWHTLRHLWETKTPRALAVSLYAGDDPNCLRYDLGEVRAAASALSWLPEISRVRNDWLLVVRRWS